MSILTARADAQSVSATDGRIFAIDIGGRRVQLTDSERDFAPSLSPDGRLVVFVRHTPGKTVRVGWGDAEAREIWIVGADGTSPKLLVRGAEGNPWGKTLAQLDRPAFLSDSRRVVFDSALAAVDGTINLVEVDSGTVISVGGGNHVEVVRTGRYRDHLIARRHRYYRGGGSYDCFWLLKLDGSPVGPIGPDEADVARFTAAVASGNDMPFTWACDDLRGQVDDPLGPACDTPAGPAGRP